MTKEPERWHLTRDGHEHTVEISSKATVWILRWTRDGKEVATHRTSDSTAVLDGKKRGALRIKLPSFTGPARQVTLYDVPADKKKDDNATTQAHLGVGGTDFVPEAGSKAAKREAWIREHPNLYAARRTGAALAGVLLPIAAIWLLQKITWRPDINWPRINLPDLNLPSIPWPDIDIPWPEISVDIPFPDIDLPSLPGWVKYVWPVLLAFGIAQAELRRRRQQDARRKELEEAELKAANDKQPGTSSTAKTAGDHKPEKKPDPDADEPSKTTAACKVPSTPPRA